MNNKRSTSAGYAGLIALVVSAAIIVLLIWRYSGVMGNGGSSKSMLERDLQAIEDARAVKNLIESRNNL